MDNRPIEKIQHSDKYYGYMVWEIYGVQAYIEWLKIKNSYYPKGWISVKI